MITPFDDFPIHQTGDPIVQTVSADPNHYDRYFFNGCDRDGAFFIGGAMGHYPNRGVIDAAFSDCSTSWRTASSTLAVVFSGETCTAGTSPKKFGSV